MFKVIERVENTNTYDTNLIQVDNLWIIFL